MRKHGLCELEYTPTKEIKEKYNLDKDMYTFETHTQLDEFVRQLTGSNKLFKIDHSNDFSLLKAFDRALWLRHLRNPDEEAHKPLYFQNPEKPETCELQCPFGDPYKSTTFYK